MTPTSPLAPFAMTICGVEELGDHCNVGVSHVLSLLDPGTPDPAAFGDYGEHERLDLRFHDIVDDYPGLIAPRKQDVEALLAFGEDMLREARADTHLLVHCHMGVSRSTASMALLLAQAAPDATAESIFGEIVRLRPQAWLNLRLVEFGDALLGRRGELIAGLREHYRSYVARDPGKVEVMIDAGRGREVEGLGRY